MTEDADIPEVRSVTGSGIPIRGNDVDTDQIIPARFMKVVTFDGLGQFAFFDQRFDSATREESRDGGGDSEARSASGRSSEQRSREEAVVADEPKDHPMNEDRFRDASVMVVDANFGCGSSREHAPQALMRWGIDALVGESFAEIFAGNCLALGIPTVTADQADVRALQEWVDDNPDGDIDVDVAGERVKYGDRVVEATVDAAQRKALVEGVWDTTALMKANRGEVARTAESLPYVPDEDVPEA